ncbi:MAG: AAA family ATPase, partial [SAR202 cluster bacterium]|nr:AAA family ATPase [SAR202 cluster bacterium]
MVRKIVENAQPSGPRLLVTTLSGVKPEEVNWLWPGRIPRGKNTLLAGDAGLGKSYLSLDIAARVSRGGTWPDGGNVVEGDVLIVTAEDGLADTVRPRLDNLGADVSRVHHIDVTVSNAEALESLSLDKHLRLLEVEIAERNAILLIIDPMTAFVRGKDSHKASDVRQLLTPVVSMAERTGCAVLTIQHLNKRSFEHNALYRVSSSADFVAVARSAFLVAPHPDDDARRVFGSIKSNLSAPPEVLGFRFNDDVFDWEPTPVDIKMSDVLSQPEPPKERFALVEAVEFLVELLADGPIAVQQVRKEAKSAGISMATLRRAKYSKGVKSQKVSVGKEGDGHWEWSLPQVHPRVGVGGRGDISAGDDAKAGRAHQSRGVGA